MSIKRGDIVLIDLEPVKGSEQGKTRPCLVIQNDVGNKASPTTIIAAITSRIEKEYPFTAFVSKGEGNLPKDSLILCNHLRTVSIKHRIIKKLGTLKPKTMKKVDTALKVSLAIE
jgi:mRNA interferase MazF